MYYYKYFRLLIYIVTWHSMHERSGNTFIHASTVSRELRGERSPAMPNDYYPIALVLPPPEGLKEISDQLPDSILRILHTLATHNVSEIAELSQLIPDEMFFPQLSNDRVLLTRPKDIAYDQYFSVERATDRPRLRLALAFLHSLRLAALNAALGHDLEPAAVADFLKSIRVMANLLSLLAEEIQVSANETWPKGKWPTGPW